MCGKINHGPIQDTDIFLHACHCRLRDDIKSSGKFAIFSYLKIEGGGGQMQITEKLQIKIKTVEDIDVNMTQTDLEGSRKRNYM